MVVHAPTRLDAVRRMRRALEELVIEGCTTNAALAHQIMYCPEFVRGNTDTAFLERNLDTLLKWCDTGEEGGA